MPLKYVDAMRQTQTSVNSVSEYVTNDLWTEAKGVTLSEQWIGTARCQILRTRHPEVPDQTEDVLKLGYQYSRKKANYIAEGQEKVPNCK